MKHIQEDMEKRNIQIEFLDVYDYILDEATKQIDEERILVAVEEIHPKMIFLVICYSTTLHLKFLFEKSGILSNVLCVI